MRNEWYGFNKGVWEDEINVRDFIQNNYTEYTGDESFLAGPTENTKKLSAIRLTYGAIKTILIKVFIKK